MLYKKNSAPSLSKELFKNPTSEYRDTPFWAWNTNLDKEELARQIDEFSKMGYGGFHMHVRQGLENTYLGKEFLDAIKFCTDTAKSKGMLAWLYDEDRWPSGVAGGMVTKNKRNRQKFITMSVNDRPECAPDPITASETGLPYFIAAFSIELDGEGIMRSFRRVERNEEAEEKRYFFLEQKQGMEPRFNLQSYVDTMSKSAIDEFIATTYDSFRSVVGDEFGNTIPAIFTDEPQLVWSVIPKSAFERTDAILPYTTDFSESFERVNGYSLTDYLPMLYFASDDEQALKVRYDYHLHVTERFAEAYMDNIGEWCDKAGIALTGHVLGEDTLYEAALNNGDIMRMYRKVQLPGIDILCDDVVYNTPIQCRSIVRQYGREGMLSELYGVTGWDFDFRGHKYQGDWQACLGVTVRVPHLAWQTMKGEGKRDYPATLSYQSAWYEQYKYIEDHYARISTALSRGEPQVRIGVIYPIDSYNMHFASIAETGAICEELENAYAQTAEWLLSGAFDFDYLSESLLPELCERGDNPLSVGKMKYDAILVANCMTLRPHTVKLLSEFKQKGGKLIFMGRTPYMISAKRDERAELLMKNAEVIPQSKSALLRALSAYRSVDIRNSVGARTSNLMSTLRRDGDSLWLFVAHMYKPELAHLINRQDISITVDGVYHPYLYDTLSGEVRDISYKNENGKTTVYTTVYDLDTLLIKFEGADSPSSLVITDDREGYFEILCPSVVDYELSEPNVLLLDMARYSADGSPLTENEEEIMRIDASVRARFGLQSRRTKFVQPWTISNTPEDHSLKLVYTVKSDIEYCGALLALENAEKTTIKFNGNAVDMTPVGYYVDRYIKTVPLPKINKGENILEISMPFGLRTDLEACYIIGDFGTGYKGREAYITEKPQKLHFGSIVHQGFAFYGGNISYKTKLNLESESDLEITVSQYRGAVIGVLLDGKTVDRIAYPPFRLDIPSVSAGEHEITYVLYGTRYNTLSALHNLNAGKKRIYMGPDFWRSENEAWAYEYQTRPMGILKTPVLRVRKAKK